MDSSRDHPGAECVFVVYDGVRRGVTVSAWRKAFSKKKDVNCPNKKRGYPPDSLSPKIIL